MKFNSLKLSCSSPVLGAYVDGLEVANDLATAASQIEALLQQHQVVIVRNQDLTPIQLRDLLSHFCPLFIHHGDLVFWDNRFSLHYPINDFSGELRSLIRCTTLESP